MVWDGTKDWLQEAVNEIGNEIRDGSSPNEETMYEIVTKHCPFKPDVAYMPVPRCETCAYWRSVRDGRTGDCRQIDPDLVILDLPLDFGCVRWEAK